MLGELRISESRFGGKDAQVEPLEELAPAVRIAGVGLREMNVGIDESGQQETRSMIVNFAAREVSGERFEFSAVDDRSGIVDRQDAVGDRDERLRRILYRRTTGNVEDMASMKVRHLLSKAQNYPAPRGECCPFCQILGSSKSCMPNKSRSQRTCTVQRPMQSNRRNEAAAAMTKPGEDETGRSGGENSSEDAGDLADDSGTEKTRKALRFRWSSPSTTRCATVRTSVNRPLPHPGIH